MAGPLRTTIYTPQSNVSHNYLVLVSHTNFFGLFHQSLKLLTVVSLYSFPCSSLLSYFIHFQGFLIAICAIVIATFSTGIDSQSFQVIVCLCLSYEASRFLRKVEVNHQISCLASKLPAISEAIRFRIVNWLAGLAQENSVFWCHKFQFHFQKQK